VKPELFDSGRENKGHGGFSTMDPGLHAQLLGERGEGFIDE
jgi:hypothetical protein